MSSAFDFTDHSHRRYNPLTNNWVLVSPHRAKRPWQGQNEEINKDLGVSYDPKCYLCPGNKRAGEGISNPKYTETFVFENDFSAVKLDQPDYKPEDNDNKNVLKNRLFKTEGVKGKCFVICFSPEHNKTLPLMETKDIFNVVNTWQKLYVDLEKSAKEENKPFKYLQIFENKGSLMGCSNPHPHGQAWCLDTLPTEVDHEMINMSKYKKDFDSNLLSDYVKTEIEDGSRTVVENDSFIVVVPYWGVWPFETMVLPKIHVASIKHFTDKQKQDLADIIKKLTTKYDNLFSTSFPYSMGLHQAPLNASKEEEETAYFHMHFYPPLLRSATVKKFQVGFEMLGEAQRDITPEQAADRLKVLSEVHYLHTTE